MTSAARDASNKQQFFEITEKHGIPTKVIEGGIEAELTFLGGTFDLKSTDGLAVVDVGGGSTELIFKDENGNIRGESLDVGGVRLTERCVSTHPTQDEELENVRVIIQKHMSEYKKRTLGDHQVSEIVAVAGTPTTLTSVIQQSAEFDVEKVHGFQLTKGKIKEWIDRLASMSLEERKSLPGMQPGREDVIVVGVVILHECLKMFAVDSMSVSIKGVRYGLAIKAAAGEI